VSSQPAPTVLQVEERRRRRIERNKRDSNLLTGKTLATLNRKRLPAPAATVNIDYHVDYEGRPYNVPHALLGAEVEVRATSMIVEILHGGERIATHRRSYGPRGMPVTIEAHRPKSHRDYGAWPPSRIVSWAASIGPSVASVVERTRCYAPLRVDEPLLPERPVKL
jgi:hypothetical protein